MLGEPQHFKYGWPTLVSQLLPTNWTSHSSHFGAVTNVSVFLIVSAVC